MRSAHFKLIKNFKLNKQKIQLNFQINRMLSISTFVKNELLLFYVLFQDH